MRKREVAGAFAFAGRLTLWTAEEREEIVASDFGVGGFGGAHAGGKRFRTMAGDEGDGINHLLSAETARFVGSEINFIVRVPFVFLKRQLISSHAGEIFIRFI